MGRALVVGLLTDEGVGRVTLFDSELAAPCAAGHQLIGYGRAEAAVLWGIPDGLHGLIPHVPQARQVVLTRIHAAVGVDVGATPDEQAAAVEPEPGRVPVPRLLRAEHGFGVHASALGGIEESVQGLVGAARGVVDEREKFTRLTVEALLPRLLLLLDFLAGQEAQMTQSQR